MKVIRPRDNHKMQDAPMPTPPHDLDAEMCVLGAMILDVTAIEKAMKVLAAKDFYKTAHQEIFGTLVRLFGEGKEIDLSTLRAELKKYSALDKIGGESYLVELEGCVAHGLSVEYHSNIVSEKALRRSQIELAMRICQEATNDRISPDETISAISEFVLGQKKKSSFNPAKVLQMGCELAVLDIKVEWDIAGILPSQSIVLLAAKGGLGKTILSMQVANAISRGIPLFGTLQSRQKQVIYIDLENSLPVLVERIRRIGATNVAYWHTSNAVKPPKLDGSDWTFYKELPQGAILIFDTLRAAQSGDENDSENMAFIMQRLKELRDCGFTILLLHHTVKSNDQLYKGSTAIFDLSDHVLGLYPVKKGTFAEIGEGDSTPEYCYRFGTAGKSRYEHFHTFIEFDIDLRYFKLATDPDREILMSIQTLLAGEGALNQTQICKFVKTELNIKSVGKITSLLKKGIGEYWKATPTGLKNGLSYSAV